MSLRDFEIKVESHFDPEKMERVKQAIRDLCATWKFKIHYVRIPNGYLARLNPNIIRRQS